MCEVTSKSKRKSFIGYKMVFIIRDKAYSYTTGIEYVDNMDLPEVRPGEVKENAMNEHRLKSVYNTDMIKRTGVFQRLIDCRAIAEQNYRQVIKMKISKDLHNGEFLGRVIIGSHIDWIEKDKDGKIKIYN